MGPAIRRRIESSAPMALSAGNWPSLAIDLLCNYRPATTLSRARAAIANCALSLVILSHDLPTIRREVLGKSNLPTLVFANTSTPMGAAKYVSDYGQFLTHFYLKSAELLGTGAAFQAARLAKSAIWSICATLIPDRDTKSQMISSAIRSHLIDAAISLSCGFYASAKTIRHQPVTGIPPSIASYITTITATFTSFEMLSLSSPRPFAPSPIEEKASSLIAYLSQRKQRQPWSIQDIIERNNFEKNGLLRAITPWAESSPPQPQTTVGFLRKNAGDEASEKRKRQGPEQTGLDKRIRLATRGRVCHTCPSEPPRQCKIFWREPSGDLTSCSRGRGYDNAETRK